VTPDPLGPARTSGPPPDIDGLIADVQALHAL